MSHRSLFLPLGIFPPQKGHQHNFLAEVESMLTLLMEGLTANGKISTQV